MDIIQKFQQGTVIITVRGNPLSEPDLTPLKRSVRSHANSGIKQIILDLGEVRSMNSAALGCLLHVRKIVQTIGGTLLLTRANENLREVLMRTKLIRHFRICASTEEALGLLSA